MKLKTRHFGEVEIPEDILLSFDEGIPGFPDSKRFVLIQEPDHADDDDSLFYWLQSADEPELALMLMDVVKVMPEYDPAVDLDQIHELGLLEAESYFVYNVVRIPEEIEKMSVNLKAPIVINDRLKKGKQVFSKNEDYAIRYFIYEELNKK
ncbi:MAG: flagellar assembly protein FliW [Defluviitaleaceae bacterium]|nr:flagellar assembly protein FliW [Defluviitaleaceae bacterium]